MVSNKSGQWQFLLSAGLLVMAGSQILRHYMPAVLPQSDFTTGLCTGVGLGLMLLALIQAKKQHQSNS